MVDLNNVQNTTKFNSIDSKLSSENKETEQKPESVNKPIDQLSAQFNPCSIRRSGENGKTLTITVEEVDEEFEYTDIEDAEELCLEFNHDIAAVVLKKLLKKDISLTRHSWKANSLSVLHHKSGLGLMVPLRDEEGKCKYIEKGEFDLTRFFGDLRRQYDQKQAISLAIDGFAVPFTLRTEYPETVFLPIWTDESLYVHKSAPDKMTMQIMLDNMRQKSLIEETSKKTQEPQ